ncbi:hypothetical protein JOD45_000143 [Scopulibacillus daqui]|uniref:Na+/glutamate symporter n=1 Tax=Scopulibacillus daqui TaxID=1469162 RepID=A0ABS2PV74_9BACL|nr:hypothetical protein [Scopulibacillus daqui]MBM7643952.1 hypothetical protein [Scopulibacillus daqui]
MLHDPTVATAIILCIIVVGEIISIATRAKIPMLLIALLGYLTLTWTGILPKKTIIDSTFVQVGAVLGSAPIIVHMGTLIPIKTMKVQWRAAFIALFGIIISSFLILTIVTFVFDYKTAVSGVGPLTGGIIAFLITSQKLKALGLTSLMAIPVLILSFQSLFGMPLTANLLRKHALKLRESMENGNYVAAAIADDASNFEAKAKTWIPERYQTTTILFFQVIIGGALAVILGHYTHISYSLWALAIGIIGRYAGFYPDRVMERANAFTAGMIGLIFMVTVSLNDITPMMFFKTLPQMLLIIIIGITGIVIGGYIASKIVGWDPFKGIPVALTATFGFPGDYLISEEISRSVSRNKEEEKAIFDEILTPMLIGGFTTVTIGSVVIASILMGTL